jgi:hypothetical protein
MQRMPGVRNDRRRKRPALAKLIDAWADLPQAIRAGIIAMIETTANNSR